MITIVSCGVTNAPPPIGDLTFDCRGMPDPSPAVQDTPGTVPGVLNLIAQANPLVPGVLDFLVGAVWRLAETRRTEDVSLVLVCSAGWHRSVAVAEEVARRLRTDGGVEVTVVHRDLTGVRA